MVTGFSEKNLTIPFTLKIWQKDPPNHSNKVKVHQTPEEHYTFDATRIPNHVRLSLITISSSQDAPLFQACGATDVSEVPMANSSRIAAITY